MYLVPSLITAGYDPHILNKATCRIILISDQRQGYWLTIQLFDNVIFPCFLNYRVRYTPFLVFKLLLIMRKFNGIDVTFGNNMLAKTYTWLRL